MKIERDFIDQVVEFWGGLSFFEKLVLSIALWLLVMALLPEPWASIWGVFGIVVLAGYTAVLRGEIFSGGVSSNAAPIGDYLRAARKK